MGRVKIFSAIFAASIIYYLPLLFGQINLFGRNNDLDGFFWPNFLFVKKQILENGVIPFWNTQIFAGTPLLADPQAPFFYLPNIFFLLIPLDMAFFATFILHSIVGGIGVYFCSRQILKLSKFSSLFTSFLYIFAPRVAGYLEAGHVGLIYSFAWLPFVFFATMKIAITKKIIWSILLSISLAAIFFTHATTFVLAGGMSAIVATIAVVFTKKANLSFKPFVIYLTGIVLTIGLTAIALFPQLEWVPSSTRVLLMDNRDVYPKWNSILDFFSSIFMPWAGGTKNIWSVDTEKWIALGIFPSLIGFYGFFNLKNKLKVLIATALFFVLLIALNNISPIYKLLLSQDWFVYMRVSTRIWFVVILAITLLAGIGLEKTIKNFGQKIAIFILIFTLGELLFLSWTKIQKSASQRDFLPKEAYKIFQEDRQKHRVFCLDRCIPPIDSVEYNIELLEGYNTLQQMNFFKHSWQLVGGYWNYYTLAVPPIGYTKFDELKPDPKSLGEYNIKYIISSQEIEDKNLQLLNIVDQYRIYQNKLFLPRAYFLSNNNVLESEARVTQFSPNSITIDTKNNRTNRLAVSTVYNKGWQAYLNGKKEIQVQEMPNALQLINVEDGTDFVVFEYNPTSYKIGRYITLGTLILLAGLLVHKFKHVVFAKTK